MKTFFCNKKVRCFVLVTVLAMALAACKSSDGKELLKADRVVEVRTESELKAAMSEATPGTNILLHEGTYEGLFDCTASGTEDAYITIASYPGERATITVPEGEDGAAIGLCGCDYITIQDLNFFNIRSSWAYGVLLTGGENYVNVLNCEFAHIETTEPGTDDEPGGGANAILCYGVTVEPISHVTIQGNKVHNNINGWSENISVASNCEYINIYDNMVYDCSNIGIDFYGNAEYIDDMELDQPRHCECIGNVVYNCNSFYASNAGIYVDGSKDVLIKDNEAYNCFYGIEVGSEEWRDYYNDDKRVQNITVEGNYVHDNTDCGMRIGGWSNDEWTGIVYNCTFKNNKFKNNVNEIILAKCDTIVFKGNKFDGLKIEDAIVYDEGIDRFKITNIKY